MPTTSSRNRGRPRRTCSGSSSWCGPRAGPLSRGPGTGRLRVVKMPAKSRQDKPAWFRTWLFKSGCSHARRPLSRRHRLRRPLGPRTSARPRDATIWRSPISNAIHPSALRTQGVPRTGALLRIAGTARTREPPPGARNYPIGCVMVSHVIRGWKRWTTWRSSAAPHRRETDAATPVLAVKFAGELLTVDHAGMCCQRTAMLGLPKYDGKWASTKGVGQPWGDANVEAAARKIRDHRNLVVRQASSTSARRFRHGIAAGTQRKSAGRATPPSGQ